MFHAIARYRWAKLAIGLLLLLCLIAGLHVEQGALVPPDADQFRDIGFAQGVLDGNWLGDPTYAGAWRWYPPLIHVLLAFGADLTGAPLPHFWLWAGPWLALLVPLTFSLMAARLENLPVAVVATAAFVFLNGTAGLWLGDRYVPPWMADDYTPWLFVPNLASAFFFIGLWLVYKRIDTKRLLSAAFVGVALGIVFLAHTVPALLLSTMVVASALGERGLRLPVLAWLAIVGGGELLIGAVFLGPLLISYHLHIVNGVAGAWTDPLLSPYSFFRKTAVMNLPGVAALGVAWLMRHRAPFARRTLIMLLTWIGVCGAFLLRHAACTTLRLTGAVCQTFVIPAHHFHLYLQAAWAFVIGHVLWHSARLYCLTECRTRHFRRVQFVYASLRWRGSSSGT